MQISVAALMHDPGMPQLCVSARCGAVTDVRMGRHWFRIEHDARHVFNCAAPSFGIGHAWAINGRPYSWSTQDKMDVGVAEAGVGPHFTGLLEM